MKKIIFSLFAIIVVALTLSSCKEKVNTYIQVNVNDKCYMALGKHDKSLNNISTEAPCIPNNFANSNLYYCCEVDIDYKNGVITFYDMFIITEQVSDMTYKVIWSNEKLVVKSDNFTVSFA